jgi:hypothetical protein
LKEFDVMRSIFAAVKPGLKTLVAGVLGWTLAGGYLHAQPAAPQPLAAGLGTPTGAAAPALQGPTVDPMVQQTSCSSCGLSAYGGIGSFGFGGCSSCGNGGTCYPGRKPCDLGCMAGSDTIAGRFFGCLCQELCCPDPCYEPSWIPAANAAFWQDGPRPVTQTRIRWDAGFHYNFPDSAEFFWAQTGKKGPKNPASSLNYDGLSLYQEVAAKGASFFVEIPYYSVNPNGNPSSAGFGDMNLGVKTVVLDRDLVLVTTQLRTFIPIGNPTNGLGTGHASLEPSLLMALKICSNTYLQSQLSEWIPLGGTPGFAGAVFHYHFSLNQNLCHVGQCFTMIGTLEFNGYSMRGQFTDPTGAIQNLSGANYYNAGPGVRMQFCDRCDVGVGMAFGFGDRHGPDQIYRTELRIRY